MSPTRRRFLASATAVGGTVGVAGCLDDLASSTLVNEDFESTGGEWDRRGGTRDADSEFHWNVDHTDEQAYRRNLSLRFDTDAPDGDGAAWIGRRVPLNHNYSAFTVSVNAWTLRARETPMRHLVVVFTPEEPEDPRAFPGSPDRTAIADGETYGGFRQPLARTDGWDRYEDAFDWIADTNRTHGYLAVGISASRAGQTRHYVDNIQLTGQY